MTQNIVILWKHLFKKSFNNILSLSRKLVLKYFLSPKMRSFSRYQIGSVFFCGKCRPANTKSHGFFSRALEWKSQIISRDWNTTPKPTLWPEQEETMSVRRRGNFPKRWDPNPKKYPGFWNWELLNFLDDSVIIKPTFDKYLGKLYLQPFYVEYLEKWSELLRDNWILKLLISGLGTSFLAPISWKL